MFINSPLNGPGSSFNLTQDRLSIYNSLNDLDQSINNLSNVYDPNSISTIITPAISQSLNIGLPSIESIIISNASSSVGGTSLGLSANSDNYFDVIPTGNGYPSDFPLRSLIYQPGGTYVNTYQIVPGELLSTVAINISTPESKLWQTYQVQFVGGNGGFGPGIIDTSGYGYVVRATQSGGGIFRVVGKRLSGGALATFGLTGISQAGKHTLTLSTQVQNNTIQLTLKIDSSSQIVAVYTDLNPILNPTVVYPCFVYDGGTVYLSSWNWYNDNGMTCAGWVGNSVSISTTAPILTTGGRRFFLITTGNTSPISIQNLGTIDELSTQLSSIRQTLDLLKASYF